MQVEGNWVPGSGAFGGGSGSISLAWMAPSRIINNILNLFNVKGNPESVVITAVPLPIVGAPFTPQQLIWRASLMMAGLETGVFKGDDEFTQDFSEAVFGMSTVYGNNAWIGPGVEWYV